MMQVDIRRILMCSGLLCSLLLTATRAADKEEMVANPLYTWWAKCKPGSTAVHAEETTFTGEEKKQVPGGVDRKTITYQLLSVTPKAVVVRTVAVERTFLGLVEAAPTKLTYPAQLEKSVVDNFLYKSDAKKGTGEIKVGGKVIACKTLEGTTRSDGAEVSYKVWHSTEVPGGIVKQVRTSRQDGKVVAETTITLRSFKKVD